jgi:hypothetical protein
MRERERQSDSTVSRIREKLAARVRVMSRGERAKLDRLLINTELLGEVAKAAKHIGVSSKLLQKWMSTPEIAWAINKAEHNAKQGLKTYVPLWFPAELTGSSRFRAKVASNNLKASKAEILVAIEDNDTNFFIDLGKYLSGELDVTLFDQREAYVAGMLTRYPSITAKDAVAQLTRDGFPPISEENFRVLKKRLRKKVHTVDDHYAYRREQRQLAGQLKVPGA